MLLYVEHDALKQTKSEINPNEFLKKLWDIANSETDEFLKY